MRILLCIREDYLINMAGDSVQIIKTANYLKKKGFWVDINNGGIRNYESYDLIHLFNLTRISETYEYFKTAQQYKKPIVITPIYWTLRQYYEYIKNPDQIILWNSFEKFRREVLEGSTCIYPSSIMESELIKREYGAGLPTTIVYNGLDQKDFLNRQKTFSNKKREEYILCVARVCPRKNQLAISKAAHQLGLRLILAGEAKNKDYLKKCLKYKNVIYKGFLKSFELAELYTGAMLHTLCSFVETPGLSSLEAGACGCNIVSTKEGSAKEYFEDMAVYCDPYDESDVINAIETGLSHMGQPRLKTHILQKFLWENCLNPLYRSYLDLFF